MKKTLMTMAAFSFLLGSAVAVQAQAPPKVLVIGRESVKVGKGAAHTKNESAFVQAMAAAKVPVHYLAATADSGPNQAWFFVPFDSLDAFEKSDAYFEKPGLTATFERLNEAEGDLVSEGRQMVAMYNEHASYRPEMKIGEMKYLEVDVIQIKPGHARDWDEIVGLYKSTLEKMNADEHDIIFDVVYGAPSSTEIVFTPRKSLAEVDASMKFFEGFDAAIGAAGRKRLSELEDAAFVSERVDLLEFSPKMSYPADDTVKENPGFWKPKPAPAPKAASSAEKKPAAAPAKN